MTAQTVHRLDGLEPDNLLAFLALLGTLRGLERARPGRAARASWDFDSSPLRPRLHLAQSYDRDALCEAIARGVDALAQTHAFDGRKDLNLTQDECRALLSEAAKASSQEQRERADLFAALMNDAAVKHNKDDIIDPTPLCLLFGQGHQHFLERLADVPRLAAPPARGRGNQAVQLTPAQCMAETLFGVWSREDPTPSFRWDPNEDVRYATMGGDPTDPMFKSGTQHGANRLAAVALPALRLTAHTRGKQVRPALTGGRRDKDGRFCLAWPLWRLPMSLSAISALLAHPALHIPGALNHLAVEQVVEARRISVGKFMNFTRARPIE